MPFTAYAFFGDTSPTAGKETAAVLGWNGTGWSPIVTTRDTLPGTINAGVPPARKLATGAFLSNCGGAGGKCIVIAGGWTESRGTAIVGALSTWLLWINNAPPKWQYVANGLGPGGRLGAGMVASPDGTAIYFFGGDSACGTKTLGCTSNIMYTMSTVGFGGASATDLDSDPNAELALVSGCPTTGSATCTPVQQKSTCQTSTWTRSVRFCLKYQQIFELRCPLTNNSHTHTHSFQLSGCIYGK